MMIKELIGAFKKHHPDLDVLELVDLINVDPTIIINERGTFCGKYAVWIGNQYVKGNIKAGDAPELKAALTTYDKNKSQLKPIKEVRDLNELIEMVKGLSDDFMPARCLSKGEQGLEKVYEDDEWIVYIPHTFEASRKIGGDTRWCTAASNGQSKFDYYTNQGPLYVNIRKSDGEKFQFHFETNSFMDKEDRRIKIKNIGLNQNAINFYLGITQYFKLFLTFDKFIRDNKYNFSDDLICVCSNNQWSFSNKNGVLFAKDKWFGATGIICDGWAPVSVCNTTIDKSQNYVNEHGDLLMKENASICKPFQNGFGSVKIGNKYNYIDTNGNFLLPDFVDYCFDFSSNVAIIRQNSKETLINNKGEYLSSPFDDIQWFEEYEIGTVFNHCQYNLIDKYGKIASDKWFDDLTLLSGFFIAKKDGKFTIIDCSAKQMITFWFDDYYYVDSLNALHIIVEDKMKFIQTDYPNLYCFDLVPNKDLLCR